MWIIDYLRKLEQSHSYGCAIGYTIIGSLFHVISHTMFKKTHLPVYQTLLYRAIMSVTILYGSHQQADYYPKTIRYLVQQGLLQAIGTAFFYTALTLIPFAELFIIYMTNAIWAQVIANYFNDVSITKSRIINTIVSLFGIVLISRPKFDQANDLSHLIGCICGLMASVSVASANISVSYVGKDIPSNIVTFHYHIAIILIFGVGSLYDTAMYTDSHFWTFTILITCCSLLAHNLTFRAMTIENYSKLANFTYCQVLYAILVDYFIFSTVPQWLTLVGGIFVLGSIVQQIKSAQ